MHDIIVAVGTARTGRGRVPVLVGGARGELPSSVANPTRPVRTLLLLPFSGSVRALKTAYATSLVPLTENTPPGVKLPAMSTQWSPLRQPTSRKDASNRAWISGAPPAASAKVLRLPDRGEHRSRAGERAHGQQSRVQRR